MAKDFSPDFIDPRLYTSNEITPLGLWRIDPSHARLSAIDQTIREIQRRLEVDPPPTTVTAAEVANATGLPEQTVGEALRDMGSLGAFFTTSIGVGTNSRIWTRIDLMGPRAYEEYFRYDGLEWLLEKLYKGRGSALENALAFAPLQSSLLHERPPARNTALAAERQRTAFVIMAMNPNQPELSDTYKAIQRACEKLGLQALRIDDIEHRETITDRILAEIEACPYVVADLTHERPNVYYEIGYAHGLGKAPILLRRSNTRLHFDLSVHKVPEYATHTDLEDQLIKRLNAVMESLHP